MLQTNARRPCGHEQDLFFFFLLPSIVFFSILCKFAWRLQGMGRCGFLVNADFRPNCRFGKSMVGLRNRWHIKDAIRPEVLSGSTPPHPRPLAFLRKSYPLFCLKLGPFSQTLKTQAPQT